MLLFHFSFPTSSVDFTYFLQLLFLFQFVAFSCPHYRLIQNVLYSWGVPLFPCCEPPPPRLPLWRSFRLSFSLFPRQIKVEGKKKITWIWKSFLTWKAWFSLSWTWIAQNRSTVVWKKKKEKKSAFSGAYFSRFLLTQDWLPFSGLTGPMCPPPHNHPSTPNPLI